MIRRFLLMVFNLPLWGQSVPFDVLITGGRVVDCSGSPWYFADVGIRGDVVVAIGQLGNAPAAARIDARGMVVAPGFVDIHSHGRRGIAAVPTAENYLREGVTTIIEGPDGSSPIQLAPFLKKVGQTPISVNFASFVGHGSLRTEVMGLVNRKATPEELDKMKALARKAMRDGAVGLSTGLFYVPGNFANTEEVIEIAKAVGAL